jgi:polysaccharide biosynthesis protein VpsM
MKQSFLSIGLVFILFLVPQISFSAGLPSSENAVTEEIPIGTPGERPSEEIFGLKGGYIHPFLSVTEFFTDNVLNSQNNKKSDFATVLSPGIWLTFPHVKEKLLLLDTANISPGGFSLSRYKPETFRRYQTYFFYNADIELYSKESSLNSVSHKAEGLFQYNLRGGLSFELVDQFLASHDIFGTTLSTQLDKYRTNLANVITRYEASDRLMFRLDYSNNLVDYSASRNNFRDRDDNAISAYIFYKFQPKTSLFYEYEFVDIGYRDNILSDSTEHHNFCGIQWDITAKSKGSIKAGYGIKDFSDPNIKRGQDLIMEAQVDHKLTAKTSLILKASRKTNETNISATDYMLSDTLEAHYLQKLTGKISANIVLAYTRDAYHGNVTLGGDTKKLKDNYYTWALAFQYKLKEWLEMDAGYVLNTRDSSFSEFDYTNNTLFLRVTGSL